MKDYVIVSDSTCDLTKEIIEKNNIEIMPVTVILEKKEYAYSFGDFDLDDFYNKMRNGLIATTAQINVVDCEDFFRKHLEKGLDVLYICFSSGLSGTFNSARLAIENLKDEFPNNKVIVVDSLSACAGEGLLVLEAVKYKAKGLSLEDNAMSIENLKLKVSHWFTVETVEYLRRGGRLSNAKAFVAKVLGIKPVLDVNNEGHLQGRFNVHGRNQSLKALVDKTIETVDSSYEFSTIICHASCEEEALKVKDDIVQRYKENGIKSDVILTSMGPVIGAHAGPGTIAVFSLGSGRV